MRLKIQLLLSNKTHTKSIKIIVKSAEEIVIEREAAAIGKRESIKEKIASQREVNLITTQLRIHQQ
jgi:hypothetical protein